jgi:hypothetical protein
MMVSLSMLLLIKATATSSSYPRSTTSPPDDEGRIDPWGCALVTLHSLRCLLKIIMGERGADTRVEVDEGAV